MLPNAKRSMSATDRLALYAVFAALWVTGIWWLVLNLWFAAPGEFGVSPHAWAAPLLLAHGVIAVPSLFLIGWIVSRHATTQWTAGMRRGSGGWFATLLLLLSMSGFALFFLTGDAAQRFASVAHEAIGVLFTLFVLEHWFLGRRR